MIINKLPRGGSSLPAHGTLESMSWADIHTVAAAGQAPNYWSVGDTKTITFGSAVLGSTNITVEILDFDYDDLADGSGKAPITFGMVDCFATRQAMNSSGTNAGGWGSCELRTTLANTALPILKAAVSYIKPVNKRTSGREVNGVVINTSIDEVWLMSEYEIFGASGDSVEGEKPVDKFTCYSVFTDASSRIKRNEKGSSAMWLERSPRVKSSDRFCYVAGSGVAGSAVAFGAPTASSPCGVAIGFCIG